MAVGTPGLMAVQRHHERFLTYAKEIGMSRLDRQFTVITRGKRSIDQPVVVRQAFDLPPTEIEQRIIRAYIQLVFRAEPNDGSQSVNVIRSGSAEVRITEIPQESIAPSMPQFWLTVFSLPA